MNRVLGIELRRSAAITTALLVLVIGTVALYFAAGVEFADGWVQLAMSQRLYLALLWPLALAAGAWQSSRDHRSRVGELFASTPRPLANRTVPAVSAMAIAVVCGYLAMGIAGAVWIIGTARYFPLTVFVVTAVGALSLIGAVWLGMAVGRLLPSLVTAPALGIAGLALLLLIPRATRPHGWLALVFSPIYEMNLPDAYATVPGRASASQALWLGGLAITAVMLLASNGWRLRVAAVLPVALGAALAIAVMPHQNRYVIGAVDPVARELVCAADEPRVCAGRVHSGLLDEIVPPAREALTVLAKLPAAPAKVHEDTTTFFPDIFPQWHDDVVLVRMNADELPSTADIVAAAFNTPPQCDHSADPVQKLAAAYWLLGREPVGSGPSDPAQVSESVALWQTLRAQPADQVRERVVALRQAALSCGSVEGVLEK
ncbi:hypothetical protein GCM10010172_79200 [Paractinoplanes ferrugineus]|uniref:Uncharacterized protein n=1 Tax=Paractinoplanes ferrugineus TaxID=113564 RepID=A0A919MFP8_9ACTN|nr:hypothetical protein [Actinoplanes ferrugineus]GIE12994.1 hypothetical protein Afe05nite_48340 [Actinoplanes ferrugineus]